MRVKAQYTLSTMMALALLCCLSRANAQDGRFDIWTGNGFLQNCADERATAENSFRLGICYGYLEGWLARDEGSPKFRLVCRPPTATNGQVMAVLIKYLRENPAKRHLPIDTAIIEGLSAAFPCQ